MKQNIIMIVILIALFFFGLLIYDFSDELDHTVTSHDWYSLEEEEMTVISFKDRKFSYFYASTGEKVSLYDLCITYRFNRSINVIKLNCNVKGNKLYITEISEDELILTIDGKEKTFYKNEELAEEANFKEKNNLSEEDFNKLMDIDLNKFTTTKVEEIISLHKSKNVKLLAFVNEDKTIRNALNLKALYNLSANSNKSLLVLDFEKLTNIEFNQLVKLNNKIPKDISEFNKDIISIYIVGNKNFELTTDIEVTTFNEVDDYNDI